MRREYLSTSLRPVGYMVISKSLCNCHSRPTPSRGQAAGMTNQPMILILELPCCRVSLQLANRGRPTSMTKTEILVTLYGKFSTCLSASMGKNGILPYIRSMLGSEFLSKAHQKLAKAVNNSPIQQLVNFPGSIPFEAPRTPALTKQNFLNNNFSLLQNQ